MDHVIHWNVIVGLEDLNSKTMINDDVSIIIIIIIIIIKIDSLAALAITKQTWLLRYPSPHSKSGRMWRGIPF